MTTASFEPPCRKAERVFPLKEAQRTTDSFAINLFQLLILIGQAQNDLYV